MADPDRTIASVRVLGGVHAVADDGSLIDLPSASQRRLLAILALHAPRRLRSEWLADALGISRGALRTLVSRVRATAGSAMLDTTSAGYALIGEVDASRFCRAVADAAVAEDRVGALQHATSLWNGPPLEEFVGEEWARGEAARLAEIHAGTVDDLADALIEARRAADAVALLEAQIAQSPYRDRSRGLMIRALASAGRQADALRAFHRYRLLLVNEFGTDPSPDVVRIERRVATGWDGIESESIVLGTREPADGRDIVDVPYPNALVQPVRFVGRVDELDALASELAAVRDSGLRSVVLDGDAGIGKTTLLAAFAKSIVASESATVVYARCDETGVSLQPFRTVFAVCVEYAPTEILNDHVAQCGGELARISPSLSTRVATMPPPTESDDATERFLAFEAASDLLRRVAASRPLVLMLDDLQWAEPTALTLLRHLARALAGAPVLLVVASRGPADHASDDVRLTLADLDRGETRRMQLVGFDGSELDDLVSIAGGIADAPPAEQVVEALQVQTAGNPLFASLLLQHWNETGFDRDSVPPSLRDLVWSRVKTLGEAATTVLTAASVLGVDFDEDVLIEMVVGVPESVVIDTLDAATRAGLVVTGGSVRRSLRFVHQLVANALYADVGGSQRARLHGLAARALEKSYEELPSHVVVELARHSLLAGWPAEARLWSMRAGDHALDHLAPAEAAHHYRVALDITVTLDRPDGERADLLVRLGEAQYRYGDTHAFATIEEGAQIARRANAPDVLVRAALATDRGFIRLDNRSGEHLALVEAAIEVTDPTDVATVARLRAILAQCLMYTPDATRRLAAAHEALELATRGGNRTLVAQVAPAVLAALWAPGRRELRSRVAASAVRAADSTGDPRLEFAVYLAAYHLAVETADHVVAARSLAKLRAAVAVLAEPTLRWVLGLCEVFEATMAGRIEDAEVIAAANLDLGLQIAVPEAFTFYAGQLFVTGSFAGRHHELLPLVERVANDSPTVVAFRLAYGIICAAVGRQEVAHDILSEGMASQFRAIVVDNIWMTVVLGYAVIAIELGDAEAAAYLLPLIEPFAADVAYNGVTSQGPVAAYAGKLASLLGQHEVAEQYLLAALETADAFGWKYHRATTLFALAQCRHRRVGALDRESEAWLRDASELCRAGGFRSWTPQIEALLAVR